MPWVLPHVGSIFCLVLVGMEVVWRFCFLPSQFILLMFPVFDDGLAVAYMLQRGTKGGTMLDFPISALEHRRCDHREHTGGRKAPMTGVAWIWVDLVHVKHYDCVENPWV